MAALLVGLNFVMGPVKMLMLYGIPYWVSLLFIFNCFIKKSVLYQKVYINLIPSIADFRNVVGFCDILASPWSR